MDDPQDQYEFRWYNMYGPCGLIGVGLICDRLWPGAKTGITIEPMDPQPSAGCLRPTDNLVYGSPPCPA